MITSKEIEEAYGNEVTIRNFYGQEVSGSIGFARDGVFKIWVAGERVQRMYYTVAWQIVPPRKTATEQFLELPVGAVFRLEWAKHYPNLGDVAALTRIKLSDSHYAVHDRPGYWLVMKALGASSVIDEDKVDVVRVES